MLDFNMSGTCSDPHFLTRWDNLNEEEEEKRNEFQMRGAEILYLHFQLGFPVLALFTLTSLFLPCHSICVSSYMHAFITVCSTC